MLMVVADAYFKGLMRTDIKPVYPYMRKEVMLQMPEKYDSIGFIKRHLMDISKRWMMIMVAWLHGTL